MSKQIVFCRDCKFCVGRISGNYKCGNKNVVDYYKKEIPIHMIGRDYAIMSGRQEIGRSGCSFKPKEEKPNIVFYPSDPDHNNSKFMRDKDGNVFDQVRTNQGREHCYICGIKTVKVDSGMFTVYDICPKCKV